MALEWALQSDDLAALVLGLFASHDWETGHPLLHRTLAEPVIGWWASELINALVTPGIIAKQLAEVFAPQTSPRATPITSSPATRSIRHVTVKTPANALR